MNKEQIASNIAEARKRSGLNQSELARRLGIRPQSVQQWEKGTATPKLDRLTAIAQVLGVSLESLTGQEPIPVVKEETVDSDPDDIIKIPRFNAIASMGAGDVVYPDEDQVVEHLSIRKSWLRQHVSCSSFNKLEVITGRGDSMVPTFENGDILLVDTGIEKITSDAIYALNIGGELFVKRIQRNIDGGLIVISDNKDYEKMYIPKDELDTVRVIGKIVFAWTASRL